MFKFEEFEKAWRESDNDEKGVQIYIPVNITNGMYISLSFGNGDALSNEDIDKGYTRYIHVESIIFSSNEQETTAGPSGDLLLIEDEFNEYKNDLFRFIRDGLDIADIVPRLYDIPKDLRVSIKESEIIIIRLFSI